MPRRYKPLHEQIVVITGGTSGIGLATAREAARRGARVVVAARNEAVLKTVCDDIRARGGQAAYAVADVGREEDVRHIAEVAQEAFGGFGTWVNNAGVAVFAHLVDLPHEDHQRLMQTNYWGMVYGSRAAVEYLREQPNGGTLINIASINADMPVPILGAYSATKAAIKAYSDVLRMELLEKGEPVAVSLIKPSGIATPISDHGRSHLATRGRIMPPLYDPHVVAEAILTAAQQPVRDVTVGAVGRFLSLVAKVFPPVSDRVVGWILEQALKSGKPRLPTDTLYSPGLDGHVYLDGRKRGLSFSLYTYARLHPLRAIGGLAAVGGLVLLLFGRASARR